MGCKCGKKSAARPTGTQNPNNPNRQGQAESSDPRTSTGLNAGSSRTQRFVLQKPNGSVEAYGSKLEAMAEQARNGGTLRF